MANGGKTQKTLLGLLAAFLLLVSLEGAAQNKTGSTNAAAARHALVISIDGLGASWYMAPPANLRIPNLRRLMQEGSYAEGVVGVYPSVTYPSHTTLVTGRLPREHGIYSNLSSRQAGQHPGDWFWFASAIKTPTLWEEARRAGLKTAAASWPVTVGAAIDWNIPEYWDPARSEHLNLALLAKHSTPGLVAEAAWNLDPPAKGTPEDVLRVRFAAYLLKKYRPNLTLVHLVDLDGAEHTYGPASPETIAAVERADGYVGELLAAVKEAGLAESTSHKVLRHLLAVHIDLVVRSLTRCGPVIHCVSAVARSQHDQIQPVPPIQRQILHLARIHIATQR